MIQQSKRAIGVMVTRGNVQHKLYIVHYVRTTVEEVKTAECKSKQKNKWGPGQGNYSWFAHRTLLGCGTVHKFRNSYAFYVQ